MHPTDRRAITLLAAVLICAAFVWWLGRLTAGEQPLQVIVGSRVATMESVIAWCGGDSARAEAVAQPIPVRGSYLSSPRLRAEMLYNRLALRWLTPAAALAALCTALLRPRRLRVICALLVCVLAIDFALRWLLSGSVPLAGRAESAAAAAVILSAALSVCSRRNVVCIGLAGVLALTLISALLWSHPAVRPLPDDLRSVWLPVHVVLVIGAYALLALGTIVSAAAPSRPRRAFMLLAAATLLLAAGIGAGSAWAAEAWGSWWSWDPKETCALITLTLCILILAVWRRLPPWLRRWLPCAALVAVAVTWWGISFLGGLHAY